MPTQTLHAQMATTITVIEDGEIIIQQGDQKILISADLAACFIDKLDKARDDNEAERDERYAEKARMTENATKLLAINDFHAGRG